MFIPFYMVIVVQMQRMATPAALSSAFAYTYLAVLAVAARPGCLFCGIMSRSLRSVPIAIPS